MQDRDADALAPAPVNGEPRPAGVIRRSPAEFQVHELPAHRPDGEGPHLWLQLERSAMNTEHAARLLARAAGVAPREVGYAGMKDRHAVARQWFSVPYAGTCETLAPALREAGLSLIEGARSRRKLRRGALEGNRFRILVHAPRADAAALERGAATLRRAGAPNYFGPQRFGHGGANLEQARRMLAGQARVRERHRRGLYLSAARAALFNRVLAARVRDGTWCRLLPGEAVALAGSGSFFVAAAPDGDLQRRLEAFDVHPSGPLWGQGASPACGQAAEVERAALAGCEELMVGLASAGLRQARRALRVQLRGLTLGPAPGGDWWLDFTLPAGAYATVALSELFDVRDAAAAGPVVEPGQG